MKVGIQQHWLDRQQKRFTALKILSTSVFSFCRLKHNNNIGKFWIDLKRIYWKWAQHDLRVQGAYEYAF